MQERRADLATRNRPVDIYTTLDLHLQRLPKMPCATGSRRWIPSSRAGAGQRPRAASSPSIRVAATSSRSSAAGLQPVAIQPRRAGAAPARVGVQAVRLSRRFERAAEESRRTSRRHRSSGTSRRSSASRTRSTDPATMRTSMTARSRSAAPGALAQHRGRSDRGDGRLRSWPRLEATGTAPARPYPSIALGVFEATPSRSPRPSRSSPTAA